MYGMAGLPQQPQAAQFQPGAAQLNPGPAVAAAAQFNPDRLSCDSPQRRLGRRAPKLGEIGRSRRVVIEDEDLDDIMNNNGL
ncbi:uncharacterized protein [Lepisosteus oculatus]|uniref:uncharacterized protein n=1 Tax=Lepisosteus oculatus TaxID=7918 RepID=UPI00371447A0